MGQNDFFVFVPFLLVVSTFYFSVSVGSLRLRRCWSGSSAEVFKVDSSLVVLPCLLSMMYILFTT